jgi:chaperonin cofactor prefoldin
MQIQVKELEDKQSLIEKELRQLEKQIYDLETTYFDETCNTGNIIKGWD